MGKLGSVGILCLVLVAHWIVLQANMQHHEAIAKPKAKIQRITLSSMLVKKPVVVPAKPKLPPIILPPDPVVIEEVKPIVEPIILPADTQPIVKPKRVKKKPKKKVKKKKRPQKHMTDKRPPRPIEPEVIEDIIEPTPIPVKPVVEQVVAPVVAIDTSSIRDAYTAQVRRQIQRNLVYPKMAKRMRMQGVVKVAFHVSKSGQVSDIRVISSPKKLLSKGAKKTLKSLVLKAIPRELGDESMDITIPIEFKLIKG